ncbi:MAG: PQQ-binding-like beta-propeller repeat protein [Planctomycetales bacterium]|nr:PQQ-binding-like beta-propeller repeat protein [Planctomycetales bacterium]
MWRANAARTGATSEAVPSPLHLQWSRQLAPTHPAFRSPRLQFDAGYEPLVVGDLVIVGSSSTDSVVALELASGAVRWRVVADGPVRCAPVVWRDRVFFGADDGHLYTVALADGKLLRRQRLAPGNRQLLGNSRLISVWPVRGGCVVADDRLYVACGVWPSEGVFVYCFDAASGEEIWHNDRLGYLYGGHPHQAEAFGGLAPQGYLLIDGEQLVVPCSTAYPARLSRATGELVEFELPLPGRKPGGWFTALDADAARRVRRGELQFDQQVNAQEHEDGPRHSGNAIGTSRRIQCAGQSVSFAEPPVKVPGEVHALVVANGHLVAATKDGWLHCYSTKNAQEPVVRRLHAGAAEIPADDGRGFALIVGASSLVDGELLPGVGTKVTKDRQWVVLERDGAKVAALRDKWRQQGQPAARRAAIVSALNDIALPPYFVAEILVGDCDDQVLEQLPMLLRCLRPFGGELRVRCDGEQHEQIKLAAARHDSGVLDVVREDAATRVRLAGALTGSADYLGQWQATNDSLVKAPLGVLWFDDRVSHFKRSPQPTIVQGVMVSYPKDWHAPRVKGGNVDYPLLAPVFSDIYTGRVLRDDEVAELRQRFPEASSDRREPSQYRPPRQKDAWKPDQPSAGTRVNPLNGKQEPRAFPKSYGCDGGVDYGYVYSMRSGTAAFYDKTLESGTICVSGPRSGCTNSIIPAGGLLNVPYFYEGCTCSYPLPSGLALYSLPESYEQWASWGVGEASDMQRVGVNFAAPGDRMTRDGTLWLEFPSVGGPSPELKLSIEPTTAQHRYQHSLRISDGAGWPWVAASEVVGAELIRLAGLRDGVYEVRLTFSGVNRQRDEPETRQTVQVNGRAVEVDLRSVAAASVVATVDDVAVTAGALELKLAATQGLTRISGIEAIRQRP